jgi:hypothetical protein
MKDWRRKVGKENIVDSNIMRDMILLESARKKDGCTKWWKKMNTKENNDFDDESKNYSHEDDGDSFVVELVTHAD